ncbi:hypothetical protein AWB68_06898 [Caballeronia choica]|uniref:Antitoxin Xre/MbcA/ParS-like toxin-binding domain-containing protein n=1 Tax=Caballeronia choica TaxID=326476 RepID=A0A158KRR3_9BURK|nr:hypothetical protein [Caballeronia choica]SAL83423.1 hypothetical protein AWB68_06898 [Caballeronia choica]
MHAASHHELDLGAIAEKLDSSAMPAVRTAIGELSRVPEKGVQSLLNLTDSELGQLFKDGMLSSIAGDVAGSRSGSRGTPRGAVSGAELDAFLGPLSEDLLRERQSLVEKQLLVPSAKMCQLLGISRQALNQNLAAEKIFAVEIGGNQYYPVFYADPTLNRRQLEHVSKLLGGLNGWTKWLFFTRPKRSLGKGVTPVAAFRAGQAADVKAAARAFIES